MTVEQLLQPRYKVIADYPFSGLSVGDILPSSDATPGYMDKFPHIFKRLGWWENRTLDEMIQVKYVKITTYVAYWKVGDIVGVIEYKIDGAGKFRKYVLDYNYLHSPDTVEPSTRDQYEAQKKIL